MAMASRRTRIKGIANLPQRRKNIVNEEQKTENVNLTIAQDDGKQIVKQDIPLNIVDKSSYTEIETSGERIHLSQGVEVTLNDPNVFPYFQENSIPSENVSTPEEIETKSILKSGYTHIEDDSALKGIYPVSLQVATPKDTHAENVTTPRELENVSSEIVSVKNADKQPKPPLKRRTFIKPQVSASVFNRKSKQNDKARMETNTEVLQLEKNESVLQDSSEKEHPIHKEVVGVGHEVTLNEVHLTSQIVSPEQELSTENGIKKIITQTSNAPNSDTEYPPPPPSPSKINRSRIKAIPRLSYRKTSFSASESEDESKRNYNRHRNDSVCSTASGVPESIADCLSPQRPKEFNSSLQKKCNRTEQSRKLAEARLEFRRRFGASKPDRQRLTMIDLIFYNPTTNPMTNKVKQPAEDEENTDTNEINTESEKVDDSLPETLEEEAGKSDEENEIPVPQIKLGPNGEIILDEKSLVIESKEVKKQREELQKTKLVDGDFDTGYGIYKRQKRAKEWTHSETLRFYKALNTIGTDFTLMCELFPKRTRRELKQKFKKEEKINRHLIDRAVMQPCNFDYTELKHEVEMEEREMEELRKQKEDKSKIRLQQMEERQQKRRKVAETEVPEQKTEKPAPVPKPPKTKKLRKPRPKKLSIDSILDDSDADVSDIATQSESEDEKPKELPPLKATRSGRIPKVTKKFDVAEESRIENIMKENRVTNANPNNIEPGSIMIITESGPSGEPVHKIYMVTQENNATPMSLNSDSVSRAIQFKKGMSAQNILTISANVTDEEMENLEESNVTIPADENVTTMRAAGSSGSGSAMESNVIESDSAVPETVEMVPAGEHLASATMESMDVDE